MKSFHLLYHIQMVQDPVEEESIPENWNGADQLFVVSRVGTELEDDRYMMVALDGSSQSNASTTDVMGAWAALGEMLFQHLDPADPFREVLASAATHYQRVLTQRH